MHFWNYSTALARQRAHVPGDGSGGKPVIDCSPLLLNLLCSKGESYVTLLNFVTGQSSAAAQGTAIALGTYHTVGLLCQPELERPEYALFAMGRGFHGQLGLDHFDNQEEPQRVRLRLLLCFALVAVLESGQCAVGVPIMPCMTRCFGAAVL